MRKITSLSSQRVLCKLCCGNKLYSTVVRCTKTEIPTVLEKLVEACSTCLTAVEKLIELAVARLNQQMAVDDL